MTSSSKSTPLWAAAQQTPEDEDALFAAFNEWVQQRGLSLYPAQEEAILHLVQGDNVIVATPTGSGKSMVALAGHFFAAAAGRRSYYTAPIKALVSEKFFDLIDIFGAAHVGMITGEVTINPQAPVVCCTAEILALLALRHGPELSVGTVIMDEFHFYGDRERGWAWQVPLRQLPQAQFVLMSATLGAVDRFEKELRETTGRDTVTVSSATRPIPLHYEYRKELVQDVLVELASTHQAPAYVVHFSQAEAVERAQQLLSVALTSKEKKEQINKVLETTRFSPGFGPVLKKLLRAGVGVHHAGMLPKYRRLVERLAQQGLLTVICGTDTLGVGINVPIRTVVLTALSKFDGERNRHIGAREFHQICGRAGRAGFDTQGTAIVLAPEFQVLNEKAQSKALAKAEAKFGNDEKKINSALRNVSKVKPPENFVSWSEKTFDRLVQSTPEELSSRMKISHAIVLNLLRREAEPIHLVRSLIQHSGESKARQAELQRSALGILRELVAAGVIRKLPVEDRYGRHITLREDVPDDFALNQPLAPFALAALELLDPDSPSYALDVLSICEATVESPAVILRAQEQKIKKETLGRLRAEGADYHERMNVLDTLEHPQPLAELLVPAFEQYSQGAPWMHDYTLTPQSIARDMFERAMSFHDYISYYGLSRSEGVLLRYLTELAKTLRQTIPEQAMDEHVVSIQEWLEHTVRSTDSSLLAEWEQLHSGTTPTHPVAEEEESTTVALTSNLAVFTVMVRNAMFRRVQLFGDEDEAALAAMDADSGFSRQQWAEALDDYFGEYEDLDDSPAARAHRYLHIDRSDPQRWKLRQVIVDPDENLDFGIHAEVDLAASDAEARPVIRVNYVGFIDEEPRD